MKTRVISGAVIGAITLICGLTGGILLSLVLLLCAVCGYIELVEAMGVREMGEHYKGPVIVGLLGILALYLSAMIIKTNGMEDRPDELVSRFILAIIILLFMAEMSLYVLTFPRYSAGQVIASFFSFFYAPVMMLFIYLARELKYGVYVYILIFLCSWVCDTCAYFAGRRFGRIPLASSLSPKKTVEGAVGGVLGSVVLCILTGLIIAIRYEEEKLILPFALIGFLGSIVSMIGDLAASAIKRDHGIKDYGSLIPGHGGIMDRFDSVIFIAPVIYYLAVALLPII